MQFINTILLAATALASMSFALNTVQFINQDSVDKVIVFTGNLGQPEIPRLKLPGLKTRVQEFPDGYLGNFYSIAKGAKDVPGMLGEVAFQGFAGATYFDVSSIVNPLDTEGVKQLFPAHENLKSDTASVSGCNQVYSGTTTTCLSQYNASDDVQTVSTPLTSLVCLVGNPSTVTRRRRVEVFPREYVTGAAAVSE